MQNRNGIFFLLMILGMGMFFSCRHQKCLKESSFEYPDGKIGAHQVNDTLTAQKKSAYFDGMELDLNFSSYQNRLFVGHELYDSVNMLTFEAWMAAIPHPQEHWYWIDMKNLTVSNADSIADIILKVSEEYGIKHRLMVENKNEEALKKLKEKGLYVILWVDNIFYSYRSESKWRKLTRRQINYLHPDALSCEYSMFPLLTQSFPDQNIHFWHTPAPYNDTNVAQTQILCRDTSVKVVLVDYDYPVEY